MPYICFIIKMTKKKEEPYYELREGLKGLSKLIKGPSIDEEIEKQKKIKELAEVTQAAEKAKAYLKGQKEKRNAERRAKLKKVFGLK